MGDSLGALGTGAPEPVVGFRGVRVGGLGFAGLGFGA